MTTLRVDFNERYGEPDTIYYELKAEKPVFQVGDGVLSIGSLNTIELVLVLGTFKSAFITKERELTSGAEPSEDDSEIAIAYATAYATAYEEPRGVTVNVYGNVDPRDVASIVSQSERLW